MAATANQYRVKVRSIAADEGMSVMEFLTEQCSDSVVRAACSEGCEVEPDGECEHGCPSVLIAAGLL